MFLSRIASACCGPPVLPMVALLATLAVCPPPATAISNATRRRAATVGGAGKPSHRPGDAGSARR